nr:tryptophan aminotransferase-related protein 2-like [Physcomitrium patens]|eukprot:XP_024366976.1 tryptophan aminotransferase-related protein 2-like [Physcomitrella patens]
MFEAYWNAHKDDHVKVGYANDTLSYFVKSKEQEGCPWFVSALLDDAIRELHSFVGNAVTGDRAIVVGNGSTQLFQAALYALATRDGTSTPVVSEAPFYSAYREIIDYLQSKLFHWAGDSKTFHPKANETFIEMVTTPNNPCGTMREGLGLGDKGTIVHDLAYYWPTYVPIISSFDSDVMLFTLSKCTGHAGLRIGWAVVKNPAVAKKMAEFVALNTIGLAQDAQSRAAGLIRTVIRGYGGKRRQDHCIADDNFEISLSDPKYLLAHEIRITEALLAKKFFHWSRQVMESRWVKVRSALAGNKNFSLQNNVASATHTFSTCTFSGTSHSTYPAFIWLKCEKEGTDCQMILKRNGILGRNGALFGVSTQYARLSLLDHEPAVDLLVERLTTLEC